MTRLSALASTPPLLLPLGVSLALGLLSAPARGQSAGPATELKRQPVGPRVQLETMRLDGSTYLVSTDDGGLAELTLEPRLQQATDDVFRSFRIPFGAAVVVSIPDGKVRALVGRSSVDARLGPEELALRAWAPAASVFKVVSVTALVESGATAATRTCYHGGSSAILPDNLLDVPALDHSCDTLAYGLGKSRNAVFAKLATRRLTTAQLENVGRAFGFGQTIPFAVPVEPSHLDVPTDALEFARMAAGFWHSTLSPLHGALLAATIANDGEMPAASLVERAVDAQGHEVRLAHEPLSGSRRVIDRATARQVGRMMELTTRIGTARWAFRDSRGRRLLPVDVAGKTGTLSALTDRGFVGYSWFVGFAPAKQPSIAFAVVLGNKPNWRIKAAYVARRIVTEYLAGRAPGRNGERAVPHVVPRILAAR